ncbi:TPA: protein-L-isoaspartate(D-aspartate) O-methyltransferase [Candidatus Acetothermia bacterium]|nr:protein-L-isoaspartate(D-aspartate) O-methyltransferase [Candidatus Acetothermia bacterium]
MMAQVVSDIIRQYVKELKGARAIKTGQVERAFSRVERHKLLEWFYLTDDKGEIEYQGWRATKRDVDAQNPDPDLLKIIYSNTSLLTKINPPSSTSQPSLVASMLELLELKRGMNLLEIGAGTGYNAALMQEIVGKKGHITTIDIQEDVVEQTRRLLKASGYGEIEVIAADGADGFPEKALYDRIIATVGCPDISFCWLEQLRGNGFMLIPLQHGIEGSDPLIRIWKERERLVGRVVGLSGFMSIQGELAIEQRVPFAIQATLRDKKPAAEYPLPDLLEEMQKFREKKQWVESCSFPFFLTIADERTFGSGLGLWDEEKGVIVVKRDKLVLYGDKSLYQDLKIFCEQWERLGKPKLSDWQLEFVPFDHAGEIPEGERTWVIERKFSREIVRLV